MISVIVPAHNEEQVIGRCLRGLTHGAPADELEVIVVANACRDATAEIARRIGAPVRVTETPVASKAHSLNLGDRLARGATRVYVDADVELDFAAVREMAAALERGEALVVSPRMRLDLGESSPLVRAYYRVWQQMPYYRAGVIGSGVYALSQAGRARFERFPEVFSEDEFVRLMVAPGERRMLESCQFTVRAPRTLRDLIRVRARWLSANRQLLRQYPRLRANERKNYTSSLRRILASPSLWSSVLVFVFVRLAAEALCLRQVLRGGSAAWTRDESNRVNVDAPGR